MSGREKPIYLDNASTTQVAPEIAAFASEVMTETYGNPSSLHQAGIKADKLILDAEQKIAKAVGDSNLETGRVLFTSGGTEADAIGVLSVARHRGQKCGVAISALEHSAVRACGDTLRSEGHEFVVIDANQEGVMDPKTVASSVTPSTGHVSLIVVQNEIGTISPIEAIVRKIRSVNPDIHVHCDGVQALGKIPISVMDWDIDSLALSAHKIHGPKGVGALWIKKKTVLRPLWTGGGQQHGLRSGTQNVPGIAAMGMACELATNAMSKLRAKGILFRKTFTNTLNEKDIRYQINGSEDALAGHVLSLAFHQCPAEPLLHTLESRGILCSAGSACSEKTKNRSPILRAIKTPEHAGTIRFSIGRFTTDEEIRIGAERTAHAVREFQN